MLPRLRANRAFFHTELVAAHGSVIYLPCPHVTCHSSIAKWTRIDEVLRGNVSVFDTKKLPAHTAVIYLACDQFVPHTVRTLSGDQFIPS